MSSKRLYVIGGSNGAGKTTFARTFLPNYVGRVHFINPDLIAAGLSPFDPTSVAARAGRLMLAEVERSISAGERFAFESTLSGKTYSRLLQKARNAGYRIHLFYLWLPDAALAVARVRDRVEVGGHNVQAADVRRRYGRTLTNFFNLYRKQADTVLFFDNSDDEPVLIFKDEDGKTVVHRRRLYDRLLSDWSGQ